MPRTPDMPARAAHLYPGLDPSPAAARVGLRTPATPPRSGHRQAPAARFRATVRVVYRLRRSSGSAAWRAADRHRPRRRCGGGTCSHPPRSSPASTPTPGTASPLAREVRRRARVSGRGPRSARRVGADGADGEDRTGDSDAVGNLAQVEAVAARNNVVDTPLAPGVSCRWPKPRRRRDLNPHATPFPTACGARPRPCFPGSDLSSMCTPTPHATRFFSPASHALCSASRPVVARPTLHSATALRRRKGERLEIFDGGPTDAAPRFDDAADSCCPYVRLGRTSSRRCAHALQRWRRRDTCCTVANMSLPVPT